MNANTLLVWSFSEAPWVFVRLSNHGGDEDWILWVPPEYGTLPAWSDGGTSFGCCDVQDIELPSGACLRIGAHS